MDERREHNRLPLPPLHVRANGALHQSHDWSEGNLFLDVDGAYIIGTLVTIDAIGLSTADMENVEIRGRVERITHDGGAGITFLHRDERAAETLRTFVDGPFASPG